MTINGSTRPLKMVQRLLDATNAHDIDALVACFSDDYVNETPVNPERGFRGTEQIRRNWTQLFDGIPDLTASVLAHAADGDRAWTEWEISGVRRDGIAHLMRGVIIFTVANEVAASAKFYLEPVQQSSGDVNDAIARASGTMPPNSALK
jgi:hypothetical protein